MDDLFASLALADIHRDLARNIVSIRDGQELFDDLSDNPKDWQLAQAVEDEVKPQAYESKTPIIHRPFEDAEWANAIGFPFRNWQASRFSDGTFGIWYGSESIETTVHETVHHWHHGFLADAGYCQDGVVIERKIYWVRCDAALLDFRPKSADYPVLVHKQDYAFTQAIGARLYREGHPGLATLSARCQGENFAILNPNVLSNPRHVCYLSYRLVGGFVEVEKQQGQCWMRIPV
ncbi:MAG: RES family NAD+ phosphorylase [Betaproteobacteria bacterium]|nr:RES family NAD+ phosphorylase [Betaproteobacteria bacterium]